MITKRYLNFHDRSSYQDIFFSSPCHTCSTMIFSFSRLLFNSLICSAEKVNKLSCPIIFVMQSMNFKTSDSNMACLSNNLYPGNDYVVYSKLLHSKQFYFRIHMYKEMTSKFIFNHRVHSQGMKSLKILIEKHNLKL